MTYDTAQALRMALERRLLTRSQATGLALDRLRRRVVFERVVARLHSAEPGRWVLKGGMALEVRLADRARLTKDLDLGLRDEVAEGEALRERLVELLAVELDGDRFAFRPGPPATARGRRRARHLADEDLGPARGASLRRPAARRLAASPRTDADRAVTLPNSLAFAGVASRIVEIIDVHRHGAEKLHGMLRVVGDRENTRVRDLVDLVILLEHKLLDAARLATAARQVWAERDDTAPPSVLPPFPQGWPERYERLASEHGLHTTSIAAASALLATLWAEMFPDTKADTG